MTRLRVAPIVEGHGEVEAVRILIERTWCEIVGGEYVDVLKPIRQPKSKLVQREGLERAVQLAAAKLAAASGETIPALILVLVDADEDCPAELGPRLADWARAAGAGHEAVCVVAKLEFETWFAASAESLTDYLEIESSDTFSDPEDNRVGKGWIQSRYRGVKYSETADQPRLTSHMDLSLCRRRSPSFDKLCRELAARCE